MSRLEGLADEQVVAEFGRVFAWAESQGIAVEMIRVVQAVYDELDGRGLLDAFGVPVMVDDTVVVWPGSVAPVIVPIEAASAGASTAGGELEP